MIDNTNGLILGFEQATVIAVGLVNATQTLGSIRFHVLNIFGDDEIDAIGSLQGLADGVVDSLGAQATAGFLGASVPEPTTAVLALAGAAALLAGAHLQRR